MSLGKFLGNVAQAAIQTAVVLPCAVVKDTLLLGAIMAGDRSATVSTVRKIKAELEDAYDELDR